MEQLQAEVAALEVDGTAGGGLVTVDDDRQERDEADRASTRRCSSRRRREILEDLIVAAANDARAKAEAALADKMRELTGGLQLPPGMMPPF